MEQMGHGVLASLPLGTLATLLCSVKVTSAAENHKATSPEKHNHKVHNGDGTSAFQISDLDN